MKNRLKELRAEPRVEPGGAGRASRRSRAKSVNAIETGKYDPSLPLAFKIARASSASRSRRSSRTDEAGNGNSVLKDEPV